MDIALHDGDGNGYPNLALMKLSAWHRSQGDSVDWFNSLFPADKTYSSKVFSFSPDDPFLPTDAIKGGSGYGCFDDLPDIIEHIMPDYSLYKDDKGRGLDYSMGFLTRGCDRTCDWCVVPTKEGKTRANADIEEFTAHKHVKLMDNNVLQHEHGISQIEKIAKLGLKIDFNQGLDARLIDAPVAKILASVKWLEPIRLACDHKGQMRAVGRAVKHLRDAGATPSRYFSYVLVKDVDDALERVEFLRSINVDPFAQPYLDISTGEKLVTDEARHFCRWVNHKAEFKSRSWNDYRAAKCG